MKKLFVITLLAVALSPMSAFATGAYLQGNVFINPATGFMSASWNNR